LVLHQSVGEQDRSLCLVGIGSGEEAEDQRRVGHRVDVSPEAAIVDATPEHVAQKPMDAGLVLGQDVSPLRRKQRNERSGGVFAVANGGDGAGDEVELRSWVRFSGHELLEVFIVGGDEFGDSDEDCVDISVVAIERLAGDIGCFGDGCHRQGWSAVLSDEREGTGRNGGGLMVPMGDPGLVPAVSHLDSNL
jgi:hypothetical protein